MYIVMRKLNTSGETIVEVLIVLVVLASALGDAFVITTKALNQNRASQERAEATTVAQTQIELLNSKVLATPTFSPPSADFCMSKVNGSVVGTTNVAVVGSFSPSECQSDRYSNYLSYSSTDNIYTETVIWESATGNGNDTLSLVYRPAILSFRTLPWITLKELG